MTKESCLLSFYSTPFKDTFTPDEEKAKIFFDIFCLFFDLFRFCLMWIGPCCCNDSFHLSNQFLCNVWKKALHSILLIIWQVEGAKVVTNAKSPGSRCYGLVTMGSADEASKCIQYLHRTELSGRMISVERVRQLTYSQVLLLLVRSQCPRTYRELLKWLA